MQSQYCIFRMIRYLLLIVVLSICLAEAYNCDKLLVGQFLCPDPNYDHIDPKTQQLKGCTKENKARILCIAVHGIKCDETGTSSFTKEIPCKWTNGYSFETAMLLSVFFGMFGADRFYLGYPGFGLLKFCTFGFMFVGQLVDILLIATQTIGPADGSAYLIPYYGAGVQIVRSDNTTYRLPRDDWHVQSNLLVKDET